MVRIVVLALVASVGTASANMGKPWEGGDRAGDPVGITDVSITREELVIDMRPMVDRDDLVNVSATYAIALTVQAPTGLHTVVSFAITEPCQRNLVLDRFLSLKPNASGVEDSEQWMGTLWLWASLAATSGPTTTTNDRAQLARIDDVRPFRVKGVAAYKLWLEAIGDAASNMAVLDDTVLPAEACAGPEADELYVGFLQNHLSLPAYVISRAAPNACP